MMILTAKTIVSAIRPPYPYGGEFIGQFLFALQLCWFPMMISTLAFGFGAPGLQAANFLSLFGALDRLGGFFVLASIREFAPFVTAVVVAGVAGTRSPRTSVPEEDPRGAGRSRSWRRTDQNLVVPRVSGPDADHRPDGHLRADLRHRQGDRRGAALQTSRSEASSRQLFNNASVTDLWGSVLQSSTLFGAIIAIVCS
jgi:phospholipid/cholesterol/gamma-HCH transport system permease protein